MNPFERPFSGSPEEAKRIFDKMRDNVQKGIIEELPVPPEFDAEVSAEALEQAPKPRPKQAPEPKKKKEAPILPPADFQTGAKAMDEWQRRQEEADEERIRGSGGRA